MSRAPSGDVIYEKATNDMYTVLVIFAFVVMLIAFVALYMKANDVFIDPKGLFG